MRKRVWFDAAVMGRMEWARGGGTTSRQIQKMNWISLVTSTRDACRREMLRPPILDKWEGGGKNLKRQHAQTNQKYHE